MLTLPMMMLKMKVKTKSRYLKLLICEQTLTLFSVLVFSPSFCRKERLESEQYLNYRYRPDQERYVRLARMKKRSSW